MPTNFDDEKVILANLHELNSSECLILSDKENSKNYRKAAKVIDSLLSNDYLDRWKDNSKSLLPPDFINEKDNIMLEVMRIDDHSSDGINNPVLKKEKQMHKELEAMLGKFPNASNVFCNPVTDLPTELDHNYSNYYKSFQRAVRKHASKITNYKSNHPNKELAFLVMDETSGIYFERMDNSLNKSLSNTVFGKPHLVFFDNRFVKEFLGLDLDYFIMCMPFNYFKSIENHEELPHLVIFDVKHLKNSEMMQYIDYDESKMVSSEK